MIGVVLMSGCVNTEQLTAVVALERRQVCRRGGGRAACL
jgi:hypothetical protein